jgi:serine/threonine-protein phosphatase PGAM5
MSRGTFPLLLLLGVCGPSVTLPAAEPPTAPASGPVRTLYLIRHGHYDESQPGDESVVKGLTPLGSAQARLVSARLRGLPVTFTSLTSSTYTRARQTAGIIAEEFPSLEPKADPLLCESTPHTWRTEAIKNEKPADLDAAEKQLNQAFAKYFVPAKTRDEHDLLVCHGNVIRWFVTKALGVDTHAWLGFSVAHCSLTIVQIKPNGTFKVFAVGDTGHMPANLQSGLVSPRERSPHPL